MQMTDILGQIGGIKSVARELGVSEDQAASGAAALLPALLGGFKKQAQAQPTGLDGLAGAGRRAWTAATSVNRGNDVLGEIFGSKDISRTVAQNAATRAGIDPSLVKKMLPMLAMLVAGYMAKQSRAAVDSATRAAVWVTCLRGWWAAAARAGCPGSPRCSTLTATASRSTTSSAWLES